MVASPASRWIMHFRQYWLFEAYQVNWLQLQSFSIFRHAFPFWLFMVLPTSNVRSFLLLGLWIDGKCSLRTLQMKCYTFQLSTLLIISQLQTLSSSFSHVWNQEESKSLRCLWPLGDGEGQEQDDHFASEGVWMHDWGDTPLGPGLPWVVPACVLAITLGSGTCFP